MNGKKHVGRNIQNEFNEVEPENENDDAEEDENIAVKALQHLEMEDVVMTWREHLYNIEMTRKMIRDSKDLSTTDDRVLYCCFDLQQVLDCPYTNVGDVFHSQRHRQCTLLFLVRGAW